MTDLLGNRYRVQHRPAVAGQARCVALDTLLQREVVVLHGHGAIAARVDAIADTLLALDHPAAAICHDRGRDPVHGSWLVWTEGAGQPFSTAWARSPASGTRLAGLLLATAEVIAHAHGRGIAHGALTDDQVVVDADDQVFVRGFGATPTIADAQHVRTDVAALGALLATALGTAGDRLHRRERRELQAIAAAAGDGYATVREFVADLRAFTSGELVRAWRRGPIAELLQWLRRHRRFAAGGVFFCLAAVSGSTVVAHTREHAIASLELASDRLLAAETAATRSRIRAERTAHAIAGLADQTTLADLLVAAETLWPARTTEVPAYDRWLADAAALISRLPEHRRRADEMARMRATPGLPADDDTELAWVEGLLTDLITNLEHFAEPSSGEPARVRLRRDTAATLARTPMPDLVPLGPDPITRLAEFAHLATGEPPIRGPDGRLVLRPETGIVFVQLPGGTFHMGAQALDPARPNWSPRARHNEEPVHAVTLASFLISKFEMTQAQLARLGGGPTPRLEDALLPAVRVTWNQAMRLVLRAGIELPTEAQWEYAARAGTTTDWWTGTEAPTVRPAGNIRDAATSFGAPWADPWAGIAPVGALAANPFGLHDVIGNVAEACRDPYSPYLLPILDDRGNRLAGRSEHVVFRGGTCLSTLDMTRSASRSTPPRDYAVEYGIRPVLNRR